MIYLAVMSSVLEEFRSRMAMAKSVELFGVLR